MTFPRLAGGCHCLEPIYLFWMRHAAPGLVWVLANLTTTQFHFASAGMSSRCLGVFQMNYGVYRSWTSVHSHLNFTLITKNNLFRYQQSTLQGSNRLRQKHSVHLSYLYMNGRIRISGPGNTFEAGVPERHRSISIVTIKSTDAKCRIGISPWMSITYFPLMTPALVCGDSMRLCIP